MALIPEHRVANDEQSAKALPPDRRESPIHIGASRSLYFDGNNDQSQCWSCSLETLQLWRGTGVGRIPKNADTRSTWHELLEEPEPLGEQISVSVRQAGDVSSRTRKTGHEPRADGIGLSHEHDGDPICGVLGR